MVRFLSARSQQDSFLTRNSLNPQENASIQGNKETTPITLARAVPLFARAVPLYLLYKAGWSKRTKRATTKEKKLFKGSNKGRLAIYQHETIYRLALPSRMRCIKKSTRNEFYYQKVLFLTSFFGN
jgi:hypothetical protein